MPITPLQVKKVFAINSHESVKLGTIYNTKSAEAGRETGKETVRRKRPNTVTRYYLKEKKIRMDLFSRVIFKAFRVDLIS